MIDNKNSPAKTVKSLKARAAREIDRLMPRLIELSKAVHAFSEIKFEEYNSSEAIARLLEELGFEVSRKVAGLDTAFVARAGEVKPRIALIAEYDALPHIGHGCGHNLICAAAAGAATALKILQSDDLIPGSTAVVGTPGEEEGGGKILMLERGVFDDFDLALMAHPARVNTGQAESFAMVLINVEFFGRSSHAATSPERGRNALDALIQTFVGINALRQHVPEDTRIHGIITRGGDAVNVVPKYTNARFGIRAGSIAKIERIFERVEKCIQGAATATGCTYKITKDLPHQEMMYNRVLDQLGIENLKCLGREPQARNRRRMGSTDLGNVSHVIPTMCLHVAIGDSNLRWHSREVAAAAIGEGARNMLSDGAKAIAFTAIDVLAAPHKMEEVRAAFERQLK